MKPPCFIFAVDHRPIMANAASERGVAESRIAAFKELAVDAVAAARRARPELAAHMAILLDDTYGPPAIARARAQGIACGQPAEKGGVVPLEFARRDWESAIVGAKPAFVKVRFDGDPSDPPAQREPQEQKLVAISRACQAAGVPLVPEPLLAHGPNPAARLCRWIGELREKGVAARWWKIEGLPDQRSARLVADALPPEEGILILGKSAAPEQLGAWFDAASGSERFQGFAVGRTIFWQPFVRFLEGADRETVMVSLCDRFLETVDLWQKSRRPCA
jgi:5-dehydro-2-deoxygluconokinase